METCQDNISYECGSLVFSNYILSGIVIAPEMTFERLVTLLASLFHIQFPGSLCIIVTTRIHRWRQY